MTSRRRLLAAAALAFLLPVRAFCADAPAPVPVPADSLIDARLTSVRGKVRVFEPTSPKGLPATVGLPLEDGDRITVGAGGSVEISIDGASVVRLGENSDFTLGSARRSGSIFHLTVGSLLAKLRKLAPGENMEFRGPAAVAAVRGTELGVEAAGNESRVGVFDEGRVEVSNEAGKRTLEPNQETSVSEGKAPAAPKPLERFADRRDGLDALRERAKSLPARWKKIAAGSRADKRKTALVQMRERAAKAQSESKTTQKTEVKRPEHPAPVRKGTK